MAALAGLLEPEKMGILDSDGVSPVEWLVRGTLEKGSRMAMDG